MNHGEVMLKIETLRGIDFVQKHGASRGRPVAGRGERRRDGFMKELGVTLDSLALLRESRKAQEPDPVIAAFLAEQAGASAINVHLRTDRGLAPGSIR